MPRLLLMLALWGASITAALGQIVGTEEAKGVIYNRETTYDIRLATNRGYFFGFAKGRLRTYDKTTFYHFNIGELHSPRETRQSAPPQTRYRSYVFGKQNSLVAVRGGWVEKIPLEKAKEKGVALGYSYTFGPTMGLVKPYYLALTRFSADNPLRYVIRLEKYSEENQDIFLENSRILGAAPFTKGLRELSLLPGAHASLAFHLDWGAFDERVRALEIGAALDVFARPAPILVSEYNSRIFLNFFVTLQFGSRE